MNLLHFVAFRRDRKSYRGTLSLDISASSRDCEEVGEFDILGCMMDRRDFLKTAAPMGAQKQPHNERTAIEITPIIDIRLIGGRNA